MKELKRAKICRIAFGIIVFAVCLACGKTAVNAASISKKAATMEVDSELALKLLGYGDSIKWSSTNKNVVTVDKTGRVTAIGVGTAKIKAKASGQRFTCIITVVDSNKSNDKKEEEIQENTSGIIKKGDVLYEDSNITIAYYGVKKGYQKNSVELQLMVTNRYEDVIEIQSDCMTINGYSFTGVVMSDSVAAGKKGVVHPLIFDVDNELVDYKQPSNIGGTWTIVVGGINAYFNSRSLDMDTLSFDYIA